MPKQTPQEKKPKEISEKTANDIQELQSLEQNLQSLMLQKQAFQLEMSETLNALDELNKTKEEVYKIIGSIMLKAKKQELESDLKGKKELLDLRIKNIEKQEEAVRERLLKTRNEVMKELR